MLTVTELSLSELTIGHCVMGEMGQQIWMDHDAYFHIGYTWVWYIYTTIKTVKVSVTEVGVAGWVWSTHA